MRDLRRARADKVVVGIKQPMNFDLRSSIGVETVVLGGSVGSIGVSVLERMV